MIVLADPWPVEHLGDPRDVHPPGCIGVDCLNLGHRSVLLTFGPLEVCWVADWKAASGRWDGVEVNGEPMQLDDALLFGAALSLVATP